VTDSRTAYPGTPRWVKLGGVIALVVVVLVVIVMVVGGGNHGPAQHMPSGSSTVPVEIVV
jgi:hypothetical protein